MQRCQFLPKCKDRTFAILQRYLVSPICKDFIFANTQSPRSYIVEELSCRAFQVKAHRLDPSNKAINDKMGALRVQEMKHLEQLAGGMKKMFG